MMKGHGEQKTKKMELAVMAMLTSKNLGEAAAVAGISESTLWRWQQDPEFKKLLADAKAAVLEEGISKLSRHLTDAVDVLADIMKDTGAPEAPRVTAARAIIDTVINEVKINAVLARIQALEESRTGSERYKYLDNGAGEVPEDEGNDEI